MAKNYDKAELIADWKTGRYTQKELGYRHKISRAMAARLVKGIDKENSELVEQQINNEQLLIHKSSVEVESISKVVALETEKYAAFKAKLELFSDIAMNKARDLMDNTQYGADYKAIVEGVDKHSVTMGYNDRFNKNAGINNVNAQQNNTAETLERVIKNLPD